MPNPSRHLKQLEKELLALGEEVMPLEELDGFLAGILVCPEVIPPSEWLPVVWGQTESENGPVFDNLAHMNKVLKLVMEHYNDIAKTFLSDSSPKPYKAAYVVTLAACAMARKSCILAARGFWAQGGGP